MFSFDTRCINEQHSAVARSLSLDQLSGICFQTSSEIEWEHFTSVTKNTVFRQYYCAQRIWCSYDSALCKSTFYLLTYIVFQLVQWLQTTFIFC